MNPTPIEIPGLLSPYESTLGLVYFPRMISKIRLNAAGTLPPEHAERVGADDGFDGRCARFLGLPFSVISERTLAGDETAEELLRWCFEQGEQRTEEEIEIWSQFMIKRGWRDRGRNVLERRLREAGLPLKGEIVTMFDFIDADEGRPPHFA